MEVCVDAFVKRALDDPTKVFDRPLQVVSDPRLTLEEKTAVLQTWEHLAGDLSVATEEGMTGGEPSRMTEVAEARALLGTVSRNEKATAPTKHGNKISSA